MSIWRHCAGWFWRMAVRRRSTRTGTASCVNTKEAEGGDGKTEFGRVVERLETGVDQYADTSGQGRRLTQMPIPVVDEWSAYAKLWTVASAGHSSTSTGTA